MGEGKAGGLGGAGLKLRLAGWAGFGGIYEKARSVKTKSVGNAGCITHELGEGC